jgi:rubredoxin
LILSGLASSLGAFTADTSDKRRVNKRLTGICMKKWQCVVCGWIYDEAEGAPEEGIPPGTCWEDVPDDFTCPDCGVGKDDFEMIEI